MKVFSVPFTKGVKGTIKIEAETLEEAKNKIKAFDGYRGYEEITREDYELDYNNATTREGTINDNEPSESENDCDISKSDIKKDGISADEEDIKYSPDYTMTEDKKDPELEQAKNRLKWNWTEEDSPQRKENDKKGLITSWITEEEL